MSRKIQLNQGHPSAMLFPAMLVAAPAPPATQLMSPTQNDRRPAPGSSREGKVRFETTKVGELKDEYGNRLALTSFKSSDGTKLTMTHCRSGSQTQAREYLNKQVEKATKVVSRTQSKDSSGEILGERAELTFPAFAGSDELVTAIVWTKGPEFREIVSKSLKDGLELERQLPN